MANLQGRPSRSLQGFSRSLQGFSSAGNIVLAAYRVAPTYAKLFVGPLFAQTDPDFNQYSEYGSSPGQLDDPLGIRVFGGKIYVADNSNNRMQVFNIDGSFDFAFSGGPGIFEIPKCVDVYNNEIYVCATYAGYTPVNKVQVFDMAGNYVRQFGPNGTGDGEILFGDDIYVTNDVVYVAEAYTGFAYVSMYDVDGTYIGRFGGNGTSDGEFTLFSGNCIAHIGETLYVSNTLDIFGGGDTRIQLFDLDGNFISKYQEIGTGDGEFTNAKSIASHRGMLYVFDQPQERIIVFDASMNFVRNITLNLPADIRGVISVG